MHEGKWSVQSWLTGDGGPRKRTTVVMSFDGCFVSVCSAQQPLLPSVLHETAVSQRHQRKVDTERRTIERDAAAIRGPADLDARQAQQICHRSRLCATRPVCNATMSKVH